MKIIGCQNGVTLLTHNGREYATDRDVGEIGDELTYNLHDGARWVNDKMGADVRETFIYSESESEFNALFDEFHGGATVRETKYSVATYRESSGTSIPVVTFIGNLQECRKVIREHSKDGVLLNENEAYCRDITAKISKYVPTVTGVKIGFGDHWL